MVAPNPLWLPPIRYGCPQSVMVALGILFFWELILFARLLPVPKLTFIIK